MSEDNAPNVQLPPPTGEPSGSDSYRDPSAPTDGALRAQYEFAPDELAIIINPDYTIAAISPALQALARAGWDPPLVPGASALMFTTDVPQTRKSLSRAFDGQTVIGLVQRSLGANGEQLMFEVTYSPLPTHDGQVRQVRLSATPMSENEQIIAELRASEARFKAQYRSFPLATYTWQRQDDDFIFIDYNRAAEIQSKGQAAQVVGKRASEIFDSRPDLLQALLQCYRGMDVVRLETRYQSYTGGQTSTYIVTFAFVPPNLVMQHLEDVGQPRRTEQELHALQEFHESLIEQMAEGLLVQDAEGTIIFANQAAADLLGYSVSELCTMHWAALIPPDQHDEIRSADVKRRQGRSTRYEVDLLRRDGQRVRIMVSGSPRFHDGQFVGTMAVFANVDELARAREVEREQRLLAEALIDTANVINSTLELDELLDRILANVRKVVPHDAADIMLLEGDVARIVRAQGYDKRGVDTVMTLTFSVLDTPTIKTVIETGQPLVISDTRSHADWITLPESSWIASHAVAPIRLAGEVFGLLNVDSATPGFFTEEHARRLQALADQVAIALHNSQLYAQIQRYTALLEQRVDERTHALREAAERATTILNSSGEVLILLQTDGTITQVNAVFENTFGPLGEGDTRALTDVLRPDTAARVRTALDDAIRSGEPQHLEGRAYRGRGTVFDVEMTLAPVARIGQTITSVVCSLRDISQRKQLEQKLRDMLEHERELSQLKSRFITTVSHEFRTPLAIIQTSGEMLTRYFDRLTAEQRQAKADLLDQGIERIVHLLDNVLAFGESSAPRERAEIVDLAALCGSVVAEVEREANTPGRIQIDGEQSCRPIMLDQHLLYQIIYHLLSNAVTYSTASTPVTLHTVCTDTQVIITIQDRGIGIPHQDQDALFEAFHRGSNVGHTSGTGLGLAIVKQAVDLLGGAIAFESDETSGTTFIVALPYAKRS